MTDQEIKDTLRILKGMKPSRFIVKFQKQNGAVVERNMSERSLETWLTVSPDQVIDFRKADN